MNTALLEELGLTHAQATTYLSLLRLGASKAGPIIQESELQTSVVHRSLNNLIEHGLTTFTLNGKHKVYQAVEPERFLEIIEERKQRFEKLLPELKKQEEQAQEHEEALVFKGVKGIRNAYHKILDTQPEQYLTFGGGPATAEIMGMPFWLNMHRRRVDKNIPSRQVFDLAVKDIGGEEIKALPQTDIRYLPADYAQFQETVIAGDTVLIAVFTQTPYALLIQDASVAQGYKRYFEDIWKQAQ